MRVLMLTPGYPPMPGGGERYVAALAQELAARGHDIVAITSMTERPEAFWTSTHAGEAVAEVQRKGLGVIRLPLRGFSGGRLPMLLLRKTMAVSGALGDVALPLLERWGQRFPGLVGLEQAALATETPLVVHSFNASWEQCLLTGSHVARIFAAPHVISPFFHVGVKSAGRVWRNNGMPHQRRVLVEADAVLTNTVSERDGLVRLGVDHSRLHIVGAAIPPMPDADRSDRPVRLSERLTTGDAPLVLFLGRVSNDKGALLAMRAIARLSQLGIPCRLALAGQPAPEAQRLAKRLAQQGHPVHLLGLVDESTKAWLLSHCTALVLPSRTDSFGLVLLEAWQYGKPVVVASVGGPADLVSHGIDGLQVPWGDVDALAGALQCLLTDRIYAARLGAAGQAMAASRFSWSAVADRVEDAYRTAVADYKNRQRGGPR